MVVQVQKTESVRDCPQLTHSESPVCDTVAFLSIVFRVTGFLH